MLLGIDASQANRKVRSGTEWYAFHLIQEFKKLLRGRDDVRVVLYLHGVPQADLVNNLPENFSVKILRWPLKYFWGQGRLSLEILVNPPDVLFCPAHTIPLVHPHPLPNPPHKGEGKEKRDNSSPLSGGGEVGGKTFTTLHDIGFEDNPELYDKLSLWYHRWSAKFAVKHAYHIFTVSEFSKRRIMEVYGCPEEKLSVIYLGCDLSRPSGTLPRPGEGNKTAPLPRRWGEVACPPKPRRRRGREVEGYILFIGRLEPKKNILNIVKGYESFLSFPSAAAEESILDLILAGRKIRISDVENYLNSRPELAKRVRFTGYISEEEKQQLYRDAAVFVFPTLYEGFGLPILEAQGAGVPVVTSNRASNPEIAGKGAVIVDPENPFEIARAIRELLTNQNLRDEKIRLGLENVKRFSWERTAKLTLAKLMSSPT